MKRNYILLMIALAGFVIAPTMALAADVTFGGQIRPRYNIDSDHDDNTNQNAFFDTRVRLNANAKVNANTAVFLQFQSVGTWGSDENIAGTMAGSRRATGGGTSTTDNAAMQASDLLDDVGFHQAYLTLKNLYGYSVDAKIGRQEVILDGHRLFGHTGWTQGAETKDAIRLTHAGGNHTINYLYIKGRESDANGASNSEDHDVHVAHVQTQGVMGGALSGIFTYTNDDDAGSGAADVERWFTIGARQKGKLNGLDYRVEFYHQFGDAGVVGNACGCAVTGASGNGDSVDRDAQMFGIRVGKTFKNAKYSPTVTLWYDNLSGQDDDDGAGGDWGQFDTMYDTGHKFYGFQDFYLARNGGGTGFYGMQDFAIKTKFALQPGWTLKADLHAFYTQSDLDGGDTDTTRAADATLGADNERDNDLGQEIDLTLVHKYDSNTTIAAGYSHYFTTQTFAEINQGDVIQSDGSDWAYIQVDTKF